MKLNEAIEAREPQRTLLAQDIAPSKCNPLKSAGVEEHMLSHLSAILSRFIRLASKRYYQYTCKSRVDTSRDEMYARVDQILELYIPKSELIRAK